MLSKIMRFFLTAGASIKNVSKTNGRFPKMLKLSLFALVTCRAITLETCLRMEKGIREIIPESKNTTHYIHLLREYCAAAA